MGFVLEDHELQLVDSPLYGEYVFPLINASDVLNSIEGKSNRYIINVSSLTLNQLKQLKEIYDILIERVYPYRQTVKRERNKKYWWIYNEARPGLYNSISTLDKCLVNGVVSKYTIFDFLPTRTVFTNAVNVFPINDFISFALLSSSLHQLWAEKLGSTLGQTNRYNPTDCFETFPISLKGEESFLKNIGKEYFEFRKSVSVKSNLGLTKVFNQFHNPQLKVGLSGSECQDYSKETWNLYNHLEVKKVGKASFEEVVVLILRLRQLNNEIDKVVLAAYGWHEDSEKWGKAIQLRHDFYEVDYLPENDRVRYTIHPEARKEVLKRLLLLNHERFEEEVAQGLHKKKDVEAYYQQKSKPIPEGTAFSDKKGSAKKRTPKKAKVNTVQEPQSQYGLFSEEPTHISEGSKVTLENADRRTFKYHILKTAVKGEFTGDFKQINLDSGLAQAISDKKDGDQIEFGGQLYTIISVE